MLPLFPTALLSQLPPAQEILEPQPVRPLPGQLDFIPVFNSNSPELILNEGILLSTFPPPNEADPPVHLNYAFQGRFDLFAHHVTKVPTPESFRTLYLGILLYNPGRQPVTVDLLQGASYLSQPDAPFISLPPQVEDPDGTVHAGPGSRVMGDILRERRQESLPAQLTVPPGSSRMLVTWPIPVGGAGRESNGRSAYLRLRSDGKVHVASLAQFAPRDGRGKEREPTLAEWQALLARGELASSRDRAPTPPGAPGTLIYGRVAGVARGSVWKARLTDRGGLSLTIPAPGEAFSYALSTLDGGTLGTGQVQSAPLFVRYGDTAYRAHGNYGVEYRLTLPLFNPTSELQAVAISLQTPLKQDRLEGGLKFLVPPAPQVFFRGTVRVGHEGEGGRWQARYFHLVQQRGQPGEPSLILTVPPQARKLVQVDFLYPPDSTPPQVLTVRTLVPPQ